VRIIARVLTRATIVLGAGGLVAFLAYRVIVDEFGQPADESAAHVIVAWTFLVTGVVAWWRRPRSHIGGLLVLAGFALLMRRFQYADDSAAFSAAFPLGELYNAVIAHAVLSYPSGRLETRLERGFVRLGYVLVVAFPLATLMVYDPAKSCLYHCGSANPPESLLLVHGDDHAFQILRDGFRIGVYGVLGSAFLALLVWKLLAATAPGRRMLAPLLVAGLAAGIRAISEGALTFTDYSDRTRRILFWWQIAVTAALPLALLAGLLRSRLARATVGDLLIELERTPPARVRNVLRHALRDPSLEIAYWFPGQETYVTRSGRPVELPDGRADRAVARLDHGDEPIAAIVYDPALNEQPLLVKSAGAAARLALENARLEAELRAQLESVRESRARIVAAGDAERQRVEKDLHDGAQQRLVALALDLRAAQRRLGNGLDPEIEGVLERAVGELQTAVEELRELAHGIHPPVLTQGGLAAAFHDLAHRTPIPVTIVAAPQERLAPDVEATAYFVACEALANVVKHASASAATISAHREGSRLVVEIGDDGIGGAVVQQGTGLRGLCDRVDAHGGSLHVASTPGEGTRIVGRIPCES
jgi:signal transduction histidine kinase